MALKYSTALVNAILGTSGLKGAFAADGFMIDVYSSASTRPLSANDAVPSNSVLLGTITKGGATSSNAANALNFGTPTAATIDKDSNAWSFTGLPVTGTNTTAAWFRLRAPTDPGTADTMAVYSRIDGTIGQLGDINLSSSTITAGNTYTLNQFKLSWPSANI